MNETGSFFDLSNIFLLIIQLIFSILFGGFFPNLGEALEMQPSLIDLAIGVFALPFQAVKFVIYAVLNFLVFDVLQLGPYLPIEF